MAYDVPESVEQRMKDLTDYILKYQEEYKDFKDNKKKSSGSRAKKALTVVKKLITTVRRDIQDEIDATKKEKKAD